MTEEKKKHCKFKILFTWNIILTLAIVTLVAGFISFYKLPPQCTLYIGLSNLEVANNESRHEKIHSIIHEVFEAHDLGYTLEYTHGGWRNGDDFIKEDSVVVIIKNAKKEDVLKACDDLYEASNHCAIFLDENRSEFYIFENETNKLAKIK